MLQAFDTIMQLAVSAQEVSRNNIDEPFRYECLCCGEEVHIAAARSQKRAPHFRHLHGNSDKDCELYLGSLLQTRTGIESAIAAAQKRAHSRAEIFFDTSQHVFYFSVSFSEEKIQEYENGLYELEIKPNLGSTVLESIQINRSNFAPDTPVKFPLHLSANSCLISIFNRRNVGSSIRSYYEILKQVDFPTFFKIQVNGENGYMAKRHTDGIIYTDTQYYIIATHRGHIEKLLNYVPAVSLGKIEEINALGGVVFGATLIISSVSDDLRGTMQYFGYTLRKAERLSVLWPPVYSVDGVLHCNGSTLFFSSSFELRPRSNISCGAEKLESAGDFYAAQLSEPIRISQTNGNITQIIFDNMVPPVKEIEQVTETTFTVEVPDGTSYYRIGSTGYHILPPGKHYLTLGTKIVRFLGNYSELTFTLPKKLQVPPVRTLMNIRQYYKVTVPFNEEMVTGCKLSKVAEIYIEDCRCAGAINLKALEYIRAGMI